MKLKLSKSFPDKTKLFNWMHDQYIKYFIIKKYILIFAAVHIFINGTD